MPLLDYSPTDTPRSDSRVLHRMAWITAIVTFPMIFLGGLVTSKGAGMSVPDWPNSYGYNMFLFPPRLWVGNIFFEHTHGLLGTVVGMCAIVLTITAWWTEPRRWVRWLATGVLGMVIFQGVLGGLRVVLVQLDLAIVHACVAQAFFCLAALVVVVTSKWWMNAPDQTESHLGRRIMHIAIICTVAIYCQLVIGAVMRHEKAGLAIPDVMSCYGKMLPPMNADELRDANTTLQRLTFLNDRNRNLPSSVTMFQVWIQFAHRIGAMVVTGCILIVFGSIGLWGRHERKLVSGAIHLLAFLVIQITLGILTVYLRKPADIASSHVAVGALVLVTSFVLSVRTVRLYSTAFRGRTRVEVTRTDELPVHAVVAR